MVERFWKAILRRKGLGLLSVPAAVLWVLSLFYRLGLVVHQWLRPAPIDVGIPVISIGNITVGGTGKTPLVALIAQLLKARGMKVGVVASGYGRSEKQPILKSGDELQRMEVAVTGDEAKLLASTLPEVLFSIDLSKSVAAKMLAEMRAVDVIIVDDGFQHRKLHRTLDIVAFDASVSEKNLRLLPYGVLREPLSELRRADVVIITRTESASEQQQACAAVSAFKGTAELYRARFVIEELMSAGESKPIQWLQDKSVFLFAGIGNFPAFLRQIESHAGRIVTALELSDHQRYDRRLLERITAEAARCRSDAIITTCKDWVKVRDFDFGRDLYYVSLTVKLDPDENHLAMYMIEKLGLTSRSS